MSTLITRDFEDGYHSLKVRYYESFHLKYLRLHIYKEGILTEGNLTCSLYKGSTLLNKASVSYSQLNTIPSLSHGYMRFDFDPSLYINIKGHYEEFEWRFDLEDWTYNTSNFIESVIEHERNHGTTIHKRVPIYGDETDNNLITDYSNQMPLGVELYWEK